MSFSLKVFFNYNNQYHKENQNCYAAHLSSPLNLYYTISCNCCQYLLFGAPRQNRTAVPGLQNRYNAIILEEQMIGELYEDRTHTSGITTRGADHYTNNSIDWCGCRDSNPSL
jgi:hypothetical protein